MSYLGPEAYYGEGPQGQLLSGVHDFLQVEASVGMQLPRKSNVIAYWESDPTIFGDKLGLKDVVLAMRGQNFRVLSAFLLLDGGDVALQVDAARARQEASSVFDPFAELFMEEFVARLTGHPHEVCIDQATERQRLIDERRTRLATLKAARTGEIIKS